MKRKFNVNDSPSSVMPCVMQGVGNVRFWSVW